MVVDFREMFVVDFGWRIFIDFGRILAEICNGYPKITMYLKGTTFFQTIIS